MTMSNLGTILVLSFSILVNSNFGSRQGQSIPLSEDQLESFTTTPRNHTTRYTAGGLANASCQDIFALLEGYTIMHNQVMRRALQNSKRRRPANMHPSMADVLKTGARLLVWQGDAGVADHQTGKLPGAANCSMRAVVYWPAYSSRKFGQITLLY
jgi:hypothetical protein